MSLPATDALLKSVSRTFYLTLKVLPRPFREPVSLAYLLARATDTVADTASVPSDTRLHLLRKFSALAAGTSPSQSDTADFARRLTLDFSPGQSNPSEADLLRRSPELLAWLSRLDPFLQSAIRDVLGEIITGQIEDLLHFPADGTLRALPDSAALDRYTYLVAGSVGAFWTRIGFHTYGPRYSLSPEDTLTSSGIRLGKALQLVNILRDLPEDLAAGRCYLPADLLATSGISFPMPLPDSDAALARLFSSLRPAAHAWLDTCSHHLDQGLAYALSVRHRRLRFATALPLNFAARTAALLRSASDTQWLARMKISKQEIKSIGKKTARCLVFPSSLQKVYRQLATPPLPLSAKNLNADLRCQE